MHGVGLRAARLLRGAALARRAGGRVGDGGAGCALRRPPLLLLLLLLLAALLTGRLQSLLDLGQLCGHALTHTRKQGSVLT